LNEIAILKFYLNILIGKIGTEEFLFVVLVLTDGIFQSISWIYRVNPLHGRF